MESQTIEGDPKPVVRPHIDLSAKLERLKRGLIADTVPLKSRLYPSLKSLQRRNGRLGVWDHLRKRSKCFRKAVRDYTPPYHFWHKEYINSKTLQPLITVEKVKTQPTEADQDGNVRCSWCYRTLPFDHFDEHRIKLCKKRRDFISNGYFECWACRQGFLVEREAKDHVMLHFPCQHFRNEPKPKLRFDPKLGQSNVSIICRDQAKRNKWL